MIVGGTHYYIEATLLESQMSEENPQQHAEDNGAEQLEQLSNAELYELLKSLDPDFALTLHPNDRRKVLRFNFWN